MGGKTVSSKSIACHLDSLVKHVHILIHAQLLLRNNQGNNKHTCTAVIAVFLNFVKNRLLAT